MVFGASSFTKGVKDGFNLVYGKRGGVPDISNCRMNATIILSRLAFLSFMLLLLSNFLKIRQLGNVPSIEQIAHAHLSCVF